MWSPMFSFDGYAVGQIKDKFPNEAEFHRKEDFAKI
jgi:hypothetical protein